MLNTIDQRWSSYYDQGKDFGLATSKAITQFLNYTDHSMPKICLDIGCGTGQLTRELYHRGYTCTGIDASVTVIGIASSLTVREELGYLHFNIETDNPGQLPNQPYSLITCKLVYAFIKDKPKFLNKVAHLLAPNGTFVIITPVIEDVPPEKQSIAVSYDQTLAHLHVVFKNIQSYREQSMTYFICRNPAQR